jgi:hypothetical protein
MIQFITSLLIALSPYQGCAVRDGHLWCWSRDGVASIDLPHPVTAIAMNARTTCAIANGALYCWDGYPQPPNPQPVLPLTEDVRAVGLGVAHACAVKGDQLYCWGSSQYGQAGTGGDTPIRILNSKVKDLAVGSWHTCALHDQEVVCFGWNRYGQLGAGKSTISTTQPISVQMPQAPVKALFAHDDAACAVTRGAVYCWGEFAHPQYGPTRFFTPTLTFRGQVDALNIDKVGACAITRTGQLFCYDDAPARFRHIPIRERVVGVARSLRSRAALTQSGCVMTWGDNSYQTVNPFESSPRFYPFPYPLPFFCPESDGKV